MLILGCTVADKATAPSFYCILIAQTKQSRGKPMTCDSELWFKMAEYTVDISTCLSHPSYEYRENKFHHHGSETEYSQF
jgi:hypothetical protein